jgi:hypothetical protein
MTTILPREELYKLLVTCDGKGSVAKREQLDAIFASVDRLGDTFLDLRTISQEIKVTQIDMRMLCDKVIQERDALIRDRDEWKQIAGEREKEILLLRSVLRRG